MSNPHGTPMWYELLAPDADAAQAFYADVIGWDIARSDMPGMDYRIARAPDGTDVGGVMTQPDGMGDAPGWLTYIAVDDVDAAVVAAQTHGGALLMPAITLEHVGRMALLADPQGHPFYVMRGAGDDSRAFQQGESATPGHAVWNELTAPDQDAAMAFYAHLFGWRHEGAMPMGPLGDYKFVHAGPVNLGASMNLPPNGRAGWQPYFMVADVDAAVDRLTAAGGTLIQGPDEIPGGSFSVVAEDPHGARFGIVGARAQGEE